MEMCGSWVRVKLEDCPKPPCHRVSPSLPHLRPVVRHCFVCACGVWTHVGACSRLLPLDDTNATTAYYCNRHAAATSTNTTYCTTIVSAAAAADAAAAVVCCCRGSPVNLGSAQRATRQWFKVNTRKTNLQQGQGHAPNSQHLRPAPNSEVLAETPSTSPTTWSKWWLQPPRSASLAPLCRAASSAPAKSTTDARPPAQRPPCALPPQMRTSKPSTRS